MAKPTERWEAHQALDLAEWKIPRSGLEDKQHNVYSLEKRRLEGRALVCDEAEIAISANHRTENVAAIIKHVLEGSLGYVSASYVARTYGISMGDVRNALANKKDFRKSFLKTNSGQDAYMLNSRFSFIRDVWNTFCFINSRMF